MGEISSNSFSNFKERAARWAVATIKLADRKISYAPQILEALQNKTSRFFLCTGVDHFAIFPVFLRFVVCEITCKCLNTKPSCLWMAYPNCPCLANIQYGVHCLRQRFDFLLLRMCISVYQRSQISVTGQFLYRFL